MVRWIQKIQGWYGWRRMNWRRWCNQNQRSTTIMALEEFKELYTPATNFFEQITKLIILAERPVE